MILRTPFESARTAPITLFFIAFHTRIEALGAGVKRAFTSLSGVVKKIFTGIRNFTVKVWTDFILYVIPRCYNPTS
jgi:hypothetical protein